MIALCDLGGTNASARIITQLVYDAYGNVIGRFHYHEKYHELVLQSVTEALQSAKKNGASASEALTARLRNIGYSIRAEPDMLWRRVGEQIADNHGKETKSCA